MSVLADRNVLVGVCGGIAAVKAALLVSHLRKTGAQVQVVMTRHAREFVTPLTFASLSGRQVYSEMFPREGGDIGPERWEIEHIALADFADLAVIVPATANIIGKLASGVADDLLSTTLLSLECPVVFAPAMNSAMYKNPVFQDKVSYLKGKGYYFMEPARGDLACGKVGIGRLPEPPAIARFLEGVLGEAGESGG
jgi:phosphopantothenoylcysteine decarboxylase/phosphopantothenate--cysteine ligase